LKEAQTAEQPSQPAPKPQATQTDADYLKRLDEIYTRMRDTQEQRIKAAEDTAAAEQKAQEAAAPQREALQKSLEQRGQALEQPIPQPPSIPPPSTAPPISKDTATLMGSIGMLIAGIGGFGSRRVGMAMNAAAAGLLHGFRTGRYDQAEFAAQQWRNLFDYQMGLYKTQLEIFDENMRRDNLSIENKLEQYKLAMAPYQDEAQRAKEREKDLEQTFQDNAKMAEIYSKAYESGRKINEELETLPLKRQLLESQIAKNRAETGMLGATPGAGAPAGASGESVLSGIDPGTAQIVRQLTQYKIPLPSGFALRSPYWQRILALATQYDPSFDATQYNVRLKLRQDFASGKAAQNIRSLNTAVAHLGTLKTAADALSNTRFQDVNAVKNAIDVRTGGGKVTAFRNAATAVESELAAVFKGMGASDQEIKAWRNGINENQSPEQLKDNISTVIELLDGRLQALSNQYEQGLGKPKDFQILSPKSRQILQSIGADVNNLEPMLTPQGDVAAPPEGAKTKDYRDIK